MYFDSLNSLWSATIAFGLCSLLYFYMYKRGRKNLEERNKVLTALRKLDEIMMSSVELNEVAQPITDAIVSEMKFDMGVLALIDENRGTLRRVAMSNTQAGLEAKRLLPVPYGQIEIPLTHRGNLSIKAIRDKQIYVAKHLYEILTPSLSKPICDRIEQLSGLRTFLTYPVIVRGESMGAMIISLKREFNTITPYEMEAIKELVDAMGIVLDNAHVYQQLRDTTAQLAHVNNRLQELDKLKDDFVSIASHELRTPMTAIRAYAWMALNRSDVPLSEKLKKYLTRTLLSTERLINLVNDMLNVSRIESGRVEITPKAFDIIELSKSVAEEVSAKALEVGVGVIVTGVKLPKVFADPDKVHQVLLNLVGNALKFTPKGGSVTVLFFTDGQMVDISIRDSGVGLSREDLGRLFQKFGRLDSSYTAISTSGGTGLGLYISKSLVELMKGRIWVSSEGLGKGTTFSFSLPVASAGILKEAENFTVKLTGETKGLEPVAI